MKLPDYKIMNFIMNGGKVRQDLGSPDDISAQELEQFNREGHWKVMRIREDKVDGNALRTVNSVIESI